MKPFKVLAVTAIILLSSQAVSAQTHHRRVFHHRHYVHHRHVMHHGHH